jgi:hypothetical protein
VYERNALNSEPTKELEGDEDWLAATLDETGRPQSSWDAPS